MKELVLKSYGRLHSVLLEGVRRLPISSKTLGPPKGLIANMHDWIEDYRSAHPEAECWYQKIGDATIIEHGLAQSLETQPPVFLDQQQIQQPELFLASIPRPRIVSQSGIIIAPDDRVFEQSCVWKTHFFTRDLEYNTLRRKLRPTYLAGSYLTLISRMEISYYHWFTECLVRLCLAESLPRLPILLQDGLLEWQRETLALLGVGAERVVQLTPGCYEIEQLYFPSFTGHAAFTTDWSFSWADWPLAWLREKFCGRRPLTAGKRLYVSRQNTRHRRIVNEDSVMRVLEDEGFIIVDASRLSIAEKIELFGDAGLIVGAHGAGLTNSLFAPSGATLVEVLDPVHLVSSYYQLAGALGQCYWYLFAENQALKTGIAPRKGFDDLTIPIDMLRRSIEAAEARGCRNIAG
jgi:hypothetical protein